MDRLEAEAARQGSPVERRADFRGVGLVHMEPEEMEQILADTVPKDFKSRLNRIGLEYQTPARP